MRKTFLLLIVFILIASCKEDEVERCTAITDPLTQVQPLKDLVEGTHACGSGELTIYSCRYQNEIVYYFQKLNTTDAACALGVYDCLGTLLFDGTDEEQVNEFFTGRTACETLLEKTCIVASPLTNVKPLRDLIDGTHTCAGGDITIYKCRYERETVYYFEKPYTTEPACRLAVFNCFGELLFDATNESKVKAFVAARTECETLWEDSCPVITNPLIKIQPLNNLINGTHECSASELVIYSCQYQGETVYYFANPFDPLGSCGARVYNCYGDEIVRRSDINYGHFFFSKSNCVVLWQSKDTGIYTNPIFKIEDLTYRTEDFLFYDSSSYILYFNENQDAFYDMPHNTPFSFFADTVKIWDGVVWFTLMSHFPQTPYFTTPSYNQDYILNFKYTFTGPEDPRKDRRLIDAFASVNKLEPGLSVIIKSIDRNALNVSLTIQVKNHGETSLLILDPDKMGFNRFHYFTHGPVFLDRSQPKYYYCNIDSEPTPSFDYWELGWFTAIEPGQIIEYSMEYTLETNLEYGDYEVYFTFPGPGLSRIKREDLFQSEGRIWLGSVGTHIKTR